MRIPADTKTRIALICTVAIASVVIGVAAWFLKWLVRTISDAVTSHFDAAGGNWYFIVAVTAGILLVALFVRKVARTPLEHATEQLKTRLKTKNGFMPLKLTIYPLLTSAVTLGVGGSAGGEGPIAFTGGAIGSNIARLFKFDNEGLMVFMACGAGAGIAAIFKSPVGGIFFTIEVLRMQLGVIPVLMLGAMCVIADITALALTGFRPDITPPGGELIFDWQMLLPAVIIGLAGGVYAAYYRWTSHITRRKLERINKPVLRNIVSGLGVGLCIAMFPALYGEGYGVLSELARDEVTRAMEGSVTSFLNPHLMPIAGLCGVLLLKGFATAGTNSGGGVAGEFTPTLFAGGVIGTLFYMLTDGWMPLPAGIICGMAAGMSGIIRAPLMSIFIVTEMTQTPGLMLPVSLCAVISLFISKLITNEADGRPWGPPGLSQDN